MTVDRQYTALFPFCGLGAGALGFLNARAEFSGLDLVSRFRSLGGIDFDAKACADFETITGTRALCADVETLTVDELRAYAGSTAPDVVFSSPPCKGASGLLGEEKAQTPHYAALNKLAVVWVRLMLAAWKTPPKLFLLENVPRLKKRASETLREVRKLLREAGYVIDEGYHDCGVIGGLAQHRRRYLLVARHAARVTTLLYKPLEKRVRGCGEVIGALPLPMDPSAGPMHRLPKLSWLNWVRLALIPPGGDWRDLPSPERMAAQRENAHDRYVVLDMEDPARTITGASRPGSGALSVADSRVPAFGFRDPRIDGSTYPVYGVCRWTRPMGVITGQSMPGGGLFSVADPRLTCAPRDGSSAYGVLPWRQPSYAVTGAACVDNGQWAVSDPRVPGNPALTVRWVVTDKMRPPPYTPVLPTVDGTWHRPLTTLELAVLQGLPATLNGQPLVLAGRDTGGWRERIGNAVPVQTAEAIARQMLLTLVQSEAGVFSLSGTNAVWVREQSAEMLDD